MRKITQTIVGTTPPLDKNVLWLDTTNSNSPVEKVFLNGTWIPTSAAGGEYYTKDEVDENFMGKIDNPHVGNILVMDETGQAVDSNKNVSSFLATPAISGNEGEILAADENGNPVWTSLTPSGEAAEDHMSDTSTKAVQNRVIKEYVDGNYARKDGYYSQLTAGSAENLVGQTVDSEAYLIRPTGGESNEVANSVASVIGMEGNSAVWNQLVQNGDFKTTSGWGTVNGTLSIVDGKCFFTFNQSGEMQVYKNINTVVGHKYYLLKAWRGITSKGIITANSSTCEFNFRGYTGAVGETVEMDYAMFIDLTLLGIDNLTTVADVEAWLAKNVGLKPYYGYNAGTILSAQTLGIKTYGQNLLNPTTKQAKLIPYEWEENSNVYTIKNVPSGATATFTPDATGVAESITITNNEFDITNYGSGILELSAATADTYVCMKWDEGKDDDVVPYEDHTQEFDVRKVYGKINGAGEYVQCFPDGIKGIGNIKDTLTAAGATKAIGDVDLGTLTWTVTDSSRFFATLSSLPVINDNAKGNILCPKYITYSRNELLNHDKSISGSVGAGIKYINIYDTQYNAVSAFKPAMNGVPLYYELATPITYTDLVYRDGGIDRPLTDVLFNIEVNNWSMEEQLLTPYVDGNPTAVPAKISTQYGMDAVEEIDTIKHTYVNAYNEQNFNENQKAQARRNIGAVEEDGTYPNMSVGIAKNLAGENAVEAEYTYRPSNGTIGTNTGIANVTAVKGKTLKWQQLVQNGDFSNGTAGWSSRASNCISVVDGKLKILNTEETSNNTAYTGCKITSGHKYFIKVGSAATNTTFEVRLNFVVIGSWATRQTAISNLIETNKAIVSANASYTGIIIVNINETLDNYSLVDNVQLIDLTDLFGAGNEPTTVAEFEALYPLDYYAYTATPVLINNAASGIVTTGFNQWDEEWEAGGYDGSGNKTNYDCIRSKNFIKVVPGSSYYFKIPYTGNYRYLFYDANFNFVSSSATSTNSVLNIPDGVYYIKFNTGTVYHNVYKNDICINLSDAAKNGTYEPYEKHTFYFDKVLQGEGSLATIKGKLNGEGESVVVFPDGLRKAGNVFDEIKGNVAIKRVGAVDLGTLEWSKQSNYFKALISDVSVPTQGIKPNAITSKYIAVSQSTQFPSGEDPVDKSFAILITGAPKNIRIYDSSYASVDVAAFKTAMNGVILYYELDTPETYILDQTVTGGYQVNALGTERRLPEDTTSAVNAPVSYSVVYPIDAVGTITKLPINYISEGSLTNFTTELASKLGTFLSATIGISATYNQTTQEYDYSITITSNE